MYLQIFQLSTVQLFVYIFVNLSDTPSPHGGNSDNGDKAWAFIGPENRPGVLDLIDVCIDSVTNSQCGSNKLANIS